jgi:hypothetical protein
LASSWVRCCIALDAGPERRRTHIGTVEATRLPSGGRK